VWRLGCLFIFIALVAVAAATFGLQAVATALGIAAASEADRIVAALGVVVGVAGLLLVVAVVRRLAAPVGDLVEAAGRIEDGDFAVRVRERGPGEARALARAFNAMTARLEATETQRRSFLADVAHELRTPLSIIQSRLEAVLDGVYPADAEHLSPILDEVRTLDRLVGDLRTLALAETGTLTLVREPIEPALLLNETVASFRQAAQAGDVTITVDVPPALPVVHVDPARIRSVLANLVANALRHTPRGGTVTVRARTRTEASGETLAVDVRDTGPGIPVELLPRVFDRFVKGPGSSGTGLGLAIARDVVRAHGGTIEAQSRLGEGATIRFTLPAGT